MDYVGNNDRYSLQFNYVSPITIGIVFHRDEVVSPTGMNKHHAK